MSPTPYKGMPIWYRIGDSWFKSKIKDVHSDGYFLHGSFMSVSFEESHVRRINGEWKPRSTLFTRIKGWFK